MGSKLADISSSVRWKPAPLNTQPVQVVEKGRICGDFLDCTKEEIRKLFFRHGVGLVDIAKNYDVRREDIEQVIRDSQVIGILMPHRRAA